MKLLTHNMLQSHVPGVAPGQHFLIEPHRLSTVEAEFNADRVTRLMAKLDWDAFRTAAAKLGLADYPEAVTEEMHASEEFLRKVHHGLLEVTVEDGLLICPESGQQFIVSNGIPNLLLASGGNGDGGSL